MAEQTATTDQRHPQSAMDPGLSQAEGELALRVLPPQREAPHYSMTLPVTQQRRRVAGSQKKGQNQEWPYQPTQWAPAPQREQTQSALAEAEATAA